MVFIFTTCGRWENLLRGRRKKQCLLLFVVGMIVYQLTRTSTRPENDFTALKHESRRAAIENKELPRHSDQPSNLSQAKDVHLFERMQPKYLHILSYQRSGSSFLGDIFDNSPDVFFIYEPLDALFSAMYGIHFGWNVPSDIFYNNDGNPRAQPKDEIKATGWTLESIFRCKMSSWPTAMLIHAFFRQKAHVRHMRHSRDFGHCLRQNNVTFTTMCQEPIRAICGKRFNGNIPEAELCRHILYNRRKWKSSDDRITDRLRYDALAKSIRERKVDGMGDTTYGTLTIEKAFRQYFECVEKDRVIVRSCARTYLDQPCKSSKLRAVKTVRARAVSVEDLPAKYKNFRLVHLVRDPRGVARSRSRATWTQGAHEKADTTREALAYCHTAMADSKTQKEIEALLGNRSKVQTLVYDEVVKDPIGTARGLFAFLGETIRDETVAWIRNNTVNVKTAYKDPRSGGVVKEVRDAKDIATAWQEFYTPEQLQDIWEGCSQFFNHFQYDWPR